LIELTRTKDKFYCLLIWLCIQSAAEKASTNPSSLSDNKYFLENLKQQQTASKAHTLEFCFKMVVNAVQISPKSMLSNKNSQSSFSQFPRCHEFYVFRLLNQFFEQFGNSLIM